MASFSSHQDQKPNYHCFTYPKIIIKKSDFLAFIWDRQTNIQMKSNEFYMFSILVIFERCDSYQCSGFGLEKPPCDALGLI